jgi:hypothetical protein
LCVRAALKCFDSPQSIKPSEGLSCRLFFADVYKLPNRKGAFGLRDALDHLLKAKVGAVE